MSLAGKRIVNTRAEHQAGALDTLLRARGAIPLAYPCIAIVPPEDTRVLDHALLDRFDLLVLTSVNTVTILAQRLTALGASLAGVPTAAVGAVTAQAAREQLGVAISLIPDVYAADALADALALEPGLRILLPQSGIAHPALAETLRARGADVTAIPAYRTVRGCGGLALAPLLRDQQVDAVTLTSASTARYLVERLRDEGAADLGDVCIAAIGSQTSRVARECGLTVAVEAQAHTLDGLVAALAAYFGEGSP